MDDIARYNLERWRRLAAANAVFTQPRLDLDTVSARQLVDPFERLGDLRGARVLCLAGGGGQQSAAFGLLGARVTVFDLSDAQLERDRLAAEHYRVAVETVQGDMRDLSVLAGSSFELVWQPYSLNFVPDAGAVFAQVAQVLRRGGLYYFACANPFFLGLSQTDWNGTGYSLHHPYIAGEAMTSTDDDWVYNRGTKPAEPIPGARQYRHTLGALVNGLTTQGFVIEHIIDALDITADPSAEPGSWEHFTAFAPPWLALWNRRSSTAA